MCAACPERRVLARCWAADLMPINKHFSGVFLKRLRLRVTNYADVVTDSLLKPPPPK